MNIKQLVEQLKSLEWWSENWVEVLIGAIIVFVVITTFFFPDGNFGCSVHIESTPTSRT